MPALRLAAALLVALAGVAPEAMPARKPPRPVGNPVAPGIFRLEGTSADLPFADLEPLRQIVGPAAFVGLGESIHTSGGYYRMKHRVFRYLVERLGFRAFAFESNWDRADQVAAYVASCGGTAEEALRGLFTVWRSAEVRDLVGWMCAWNRAHPRPRDKVHFFGFDVQQPDRDGPALVAFLARIGVPADDPRVAGVKRCDGFAGGIDLLPVPEGNHRACVEALAGVGALFARDEGAIVRATSRADLAWARLRLVGLQSWEDQAYYWNTDQARGFAARDAGMAYALRAIRDLRHPGARTAVWAHNVHLAKNSREGYRYESMGTYLDRALGPAYAVIGLVSLETSIDWNQVGCGRVDGFSTSSVEALLSGFGHDHLLVDLDFPGGKPPFLQPGKRYLLTETRVVPARHYDALLYLETSPKMTPLAWPPC